QEVRCALQCHDIWPDGPLALPLSETNGGRGKDTIANRLPGTSRCRCGGLRQVRRKGGRATPCDVSLLDQLCRQIDCDTCERARYRTGLLRLLGALLKIGGIDSRNLRFGLEIDGVDGPAATLLVEMNLRRRVDALRFETGA